MIRTLVRYVPLLIVLGLLAPPVPAHAGTHRDRQRKAREYDARKAERDAKREREHAKRKARDDDKKAERAARHARRDAERASRRTADDDEREVVRRKPAEDPVARKQRLEQTRLRYLERINERRGHRPERPTRKR